MSIDDFLRNIVPVSVQVEEMMEEEEMESQDENDDVENMMRDNVWSKA